MKPDTSLATIARLRCDFPTKFGLPRQSGLVDELCATVVFEPEYRNPDALRGLEGFSHIWLIWGFSEAAREGFTPMVRPPRLGGNERMGVFATRSPYRPNGLGLSCVKLLGIERDARLGSVLRVSGADMMDMTPIYDIKPYLPYTDSRPEASGGFAEERRGYSLEVVIPEDMLDALPQKSRAALPKLLANDPRPAYQSDESRVYGFNYAGFDVRFTVARGVLTVRELVPLAQANPTNSL